MFGSAPTPLDLNFRLLGVPVRVHPLFWLIMALFGDFVFNNYGIDFFLIWIGCGFVSILLHEMGHALAYRFFGCPPAILIHGMGGLAFSQFAPRTPFRRLLVSAAGPAVGFALVGVLLLSELLFGWAGSSRYTAAAFNFLIWMNIFWNVLNLLPIYPLDGGQIMREVFAMMKLRNPDLKTYAISVGVAASLALYGVASMMGMRFPAIDALLFGYRPGLFFTMMLVLFAIENYQRMQIAQQQSRFHSGYDDDDSPPWRR